MSSSLRYMIASLLIAAVSPMGLAALDLEQPAQAKNGNGGGHGGGNGGGHGGGNGGGHGGGQANGHAKADKAAVSDEDAGDVEEDDDSLKPSSLGKLNGVLHASPNAIANASAKSPIGMAREFGLALADFVGSLAPDEDPEANPDAEAEADEDPITAEDLGALMAGMTNKPVTAAQVQAVADRLAADDPENESLKDIDPDLAQDIADEANEIHGFDTTEGDTEQDDDDAEAEVALE